MPPFVYAIAALLALLCSTFAIGQEIVAPAQGYVEPAFQPPLPAELVPVVGPETLNLPEPVVGPDTLNMPVPLDPVEAEQLKGSVEADVEAVVEESCPVLFQDFWGYRYSTLATSWIVGHGNQFGMVSLMTDHYQSRGEDLGLGLGMNFHFLAGPERTDMPPRVYDFSLAWQQRAMVGNFGYDVAVSIMASSDFEGSARKGIRFPGHAVGFLKLLPNCDVVFGVDYLDRGDIKILPVAGLILLPHPDIRLEAVFPRPRIVLQLTPGQRLYFGGELGGGSWAIERDTLVDDLATYRDLRLSVGLVTDDEDGDWSGFEISYIFDRKLEYTSGIGDYYPRETVMISLTTRY